MDNSSYGSKPRHFTSEIIATGISGLQIFHLDGADAAVGNMGDSFGTDGLHTGGNKG